MTLIMCSGCAWFQTKENLPAHELASNGMEAFSSGHYRNAIESFEKLKDWYPFSQYAILAELKIADAHYHLKEYEDAVAAYEEFESLHPRNEAVPYVIFQTGLCYYEQISSVDRDQTSARKSADIFTRVTDRYPDNEYAQRGSRLLKECMKQLCGHDLYVGKFYLKSKHYKAALCRFKQILTHYPDVGIHQEALQYIALCEQKLSGQQPEKE